MKNRLAFSIILFLSILFLAPPCPTHVATTERDPLAGKIVDVLNNPVAGVTVISALEYSQGSAGQRPVRWWSSLHSRTEWVNS